MCVCFFFLKKCLLSLFRRSLRVGKERGGMPGEETFSLFLALPERFLDGYCYGSAELQMHTPQLLTGNTAVRAKITTGPGMEHCAPSRKRAENLKTEEKIQNNNNKEKATCQNPPRLAHPARPVAPPWRSQLRRREPESRRAERGGSSTVAG